MAKKQITKKQHFVPRFYLRRFADPNGKLHVFDAKERRALKPKGVGRVCFDHFFYGAKTGQEDELSQEVEDFLSTHIEDPLSKALPAIIERIESQQQITDEDKYTLAALMNSMWLRNPMMREMTNQISEQATKFANKFRFSHPSADETLDRLAEKEGVELSAEDRAKLKQTMVDGDYDLEFSNQGHLEVMLDPDNLRGFTNLFFGQQWTVHISRCDRQFVTSDNPVVAVAPPREGFYGPTFLERTHFFPITPTIAIEATYPHKETGKKVKRKTHFAGAQAEVDRINLNIASQAGYLYAARPDEIEWFEEFVRQREQRTRRTT